MLLLFDIDGTLLLRASAEHAAALREALGAVYGITASGPVVAAGRTDTAIARDLAAAEGIDGARFEADLGRFAAETFAGFERRCPPDLSAAVAPGMPELLGRLASRADVRCSLVTGS